MKTELATSLKRETARILAELAADRSPVMITRRGLPAAYLVDAATFEAVQAKIAVLEIIVRGEREFESGQTFTQAEAKQRMAKWLK